MTDPVDLSWALQKAVYDTLTAAGIQIQDAIDDTDGVPNVQVFFGEDAVQELGGKTDTLERHDLTINVMVTGSSRAPMRAMQGQIKAALHNKPLVAQTGVILSNPYLENANGQITEAFELLGTQVFVIFAQPNL